MIHNKILITGSRGNVASHFIKKYQRKINLCTINKKLNKINALNKNDKLESVIHLGSVHKFPYFNKNPNKNYKKNIQIFDDIFKQTDKKISNFFFTSTIDCGRKKFPKFKKKYIASKLLIENKLRYYYKKKKINQVVIVRIPSILNLKSKTFINSFIFSIIKNKNLILPELPRKFNSITTKEDLSDFIFSCLKRKKRGFYLLNFCCKNPISLIDLFKQLKKKYNSNSKLIINKMSSSKPIECKKLNENFNFKVTSVKKAISKYLNTIKA